MIQWTGGEFPTRDSGLGVHHADLPTAGLAPGEEVRFTINWAGGGWVRKESIYGIKPSVVRVEGVEHHERVERRRRPVAVMSGANGAVDER